MNAAQPRSAPVSTLMAARVSIILEELVFRIATFNPAARQAAR